MPENPPRAIPIILFLCIAAHAAVTLTYAITQHYELKTFGIDGMAVVQLMHNVIHGKGLTTSLAAPFVPQHWFGFHFSPILYLIVPFYYLFPHIETLLALGSIAVALAAWPLYLTAKTILENSSRALLFALLYLINPFVFNGVLHDFHEVDFAPLCIATMLWATVHHKRTILIGLSIVLMCIKEHYGLSVAGFGLLWAWQWREAKFGLSVAAFGVTVLCVLLLIVIPHLSPMGMPTMLAESTTSLSAHRYSWLTTREGIESHLPALETEWLLYALKLFLPFIFMPLAAFMWLLPAIADVSANALSTEGMMRITHSYHTIAVIPVIIIACCQTIKKYVRKKKIKDAMLEIVVASLCFSCLYLNLPTYEMGRNLWELTSPRFDYTPENRDSIDAINRLIPEDASVSAQANILPQLKPRFSMVPYPLVQNASFVVLNFSLPFTYALSVLGVPFGTASDNYFSHTENLMHDPQWGVIYYSNRWLVMQKNTPDKANARQAASEGLIKLKEESQDVGKNIQKSHQKPS